eukprot:scaffold13082_cov78-Skeletonema_dohrnii-CCMP3373.AAC.2
MHMALHRHAIMMTPPLKLLHHLTLPAALIVSRVLTTISSATINRAKQQRLLLLACSCLSRRGEARRTRSPCTHLARPTNTISPQSKQPKARQLLQHQQERQHIHGTWKLMPLPTVPLLIAAVKTL